MKIDSSLSHIDITKSKKYNKIRKCAKERKNKMKKWTENKGITLIALVITIIVLLLLAAISIASLTGENGLLKKAIKAKEETEIKGYHEKIELVRTEVRLQKENYEPPTIAELQKEFDEKQTEWVASTEIKQLEGIEKLELKTKEGYIFYITETDTEYRGKGEVVDTSALKREDALNLKIVGEGENGGKIVQITDLSGVDYYKIEYTINDREGNWVLIESGKTVEVEPSSTIYARLIYETNKGVMVSLSIEATEPKVIAKDTDMSQVVRKTQIPLVDLFEITWGSDGTGIVEYTISGNLSFKNTSYTSTEVSNVSELEVGNYEVTCKVTSPSNKIQTATKQNVKVTKLANTTVTNASNNEVAANAIYSEYDLAYFRDLVNGGQVAINGKLMNDINLINVCSVDRGSWIPIGVYNSNSTLASILEAEIYYNGILDGNNNTISNVYINNAALYRQGLFSILNSEGILKNINVAGNINAYQNIGGLVAYNGGKIVNCENNTTIKGTNLVGGIAGTNEGIIEEVSNQGSIKAKNKVGGIVGQIIQPLNTKDTIVKNSNNTGIVDGEVYVGGIAGNNEYNKATIDSCYNLGKVRASGYVVDSANIKNSYAGGIVGANSGVVQKCYNELILHGAAVNTTEGMYGCVGGIVGANTNIIKECYNTKFVLRKS